MRGIPKSINAKPARVASLSIRTIAKHAGAEQRRNIDIVVLLGQMKTKSRVRDNELAVTAVHGIAGKARTVAKIFAVGSTVNAVAVGPAEPRNPDAIADRKFFDACSDLFDTPDDLMAGTQRH